MHPGIGTEIAFARTLLQQRHERDQPVAPPLALCKYFMQMPAPASSLSATKQIGSSSPPSVHSCYVHLPYLHFRWCSIYTEMKLICVYNMKLAGRMLALKHTQTHSTCCIHICMKVGWESGRRTMWQCMHRWTKFPLSIIIWQMIANGVRKLDNRTTFPQYIRSVQLHKCVVVIIIGSRQVHC